MNPAAAVSSIARNSELLDKIKFTFLCLVLYRLGAHITAPGIDVVALTDFFASQGQGGLLGLYDMFVGGGLSRATVFALAISSAPAWTIPRIFFWFGQMNTQTLNNMIVPSHAPIPIIW